MKKIFGSIILALFLLAAGNFMLTAQQQAVYAQEQTSPPVALKPGDIGMIHQPIQLTLRFAEPPQLNQPATLILAVESGMEAPGTQIWLELPDGITPVRPLETRLVDLAAGDTRRFKFDVVIREAGELVLSAQAQYDAGDENIFGDRASLYLSSSRAGITVSRVDPALLVESPDSFVILAHTIPEEQRPKDQPAQPSLKYPDDESRDLNQTEGTVTIFGYFYYTDTTNTLQPLKDMRVEIWDDDDFSGDDLVATRRTDSNGRYEATVSNGDESGGLDIYVKAFATDDHAVSVTEHHNLNNIYEGGGEIYSARTATFNNVPDGLHYVGAQVVGDLAYTIPWLIYDLIGNLAYDYLYTNVNWDNNHNLEVRWSPVYVGYVLTNTEVYSRGSFYNRTYDFIHINYKNQWLEDVILHEFGHFVMDQFYTTYPQTDNCSPHYIGQDSSLGCAWSEGWATFLGQAIQGDSTFEYGATAVFNLETPPASVPSSDKDEASVAASLWDIYDSNTETHDTISRGIGRWYEGIWEVFSFERSKTAYEFFDDWNGRLEGDSCAVSKIFNHYKIKVTDMCPPDLAYNVRASDGTHSNGVEVAWSGPDRVTYFEVYRADSPTASKVYVGDFITNGIDYITHVLTDTTATPLRHYWYFIKSCNTYGCSSYSSSSDEGWRNLETPDNVSASDGTQTGFVRITWDEVPNAEAYRIYRATTENGTKLFSGYTEGLTWDTDLTTPGVLYYFWVQPCSASLDCEGFSDYDTGWEPLDTPTGLTASDFTSSTGVDLDWAVVEGAQSYKVYRSTSSGSLGSQVGSAYISEYEDTSAAVGQHYYYRVTACGDPGLACSPASDFDSGWRAIPAPANVQATDGTYPDKIRVSWGSVSGATRYKVYRSTSSTNSYDEIAEISSDFYYDDLAVNAGRTYYYWVRACTATSCSPYSDSDSGGTPPASPWGVAASDGGYENEIRITWSVPSYADTSQIYRSESAAGEKTWLGNVSTNSYADTTPLYGTTYYYWVRACSTYGCGAFSSYNTGYSDPGLPQNLQASDGAYSGKVALTWDSVSWATSYQVYRARTDDGQRSQIGTSTSPSYDDTSSSYQVTYDYWVKACNASGCSDYSQPDGGYANIPAPQGMHVQSGWNNVTIFWYATSEATHYEIYRATSEGGAKTLLGTETDLIYDDSTPTPGVTYYYWVKACSTVLGVCSDVSESDIGQINPLTPGNIQASDGTYRDMVYITWNPVTATHYIVYRDGQSLGTITLERWYDSTAEPFRHYDYKVAACNRDFDTGCGDFSTSDEGWRTIARPENLIASYETYTTSVRITWDAVNGASQYEVYRGSHVTDNEYIGFTSQTIYDDDTAEPGKGYHYFVKACTFLGCGDYSASWQDYGLRAVPVPKNVSATDGDYPDKVIISWDAVPEAEEYIVVRRASPDPDSYPYSGCTAQAGETSCEREIPEKGKQFYFWVYAVANNHASEYSDYDPGGTPPPVPSISSVSERYEEIAISWGAVNNATHYQLWRAETFTGTKTLVASPTSILYPYQDTSAVPEQPYYYWVKSCNSFACSDFSTPIQAKRPLEIPESVNPSDLDYADKIRVTWNYSGPATFFEIYRALEYEAIYELIGTSPTLAYSDTNATPGWRYYYKVKSCNHVGCSDLSFSSGGGRRAMPAPESVQASDGAYADQVKVTWLNVPGAEYYEIYCADNAGGVEYQLCNTTSQLSFADQPAPGQDYYYGVKACQLSTGCSALSLVDGGWRAMPMPAFSASTSGYNDRVVLTWEAIPEAQNYKIWRADTPDGPKTELSYQSAIGFTDLTAAADEIYYYWVQACNIYGCSAFENMRIGGIHIHQVFLPLVIRTVNEGEY